MGGGRRRVLGVGGRVGVGVSRAPTEAVAVVGQLKAGVALALVGSGIVATGSVATHSR